METIPCSLPQPQGRNANCDPLGNRFDLDFRLGWRLDNIQVVGRTNVSGRLDSQIPDSKGGGYLGKFTRRGATAPPAGQLDFDSRRKVLDQCRSSAWGYPTAIMIRRPPRACLSSIQFAGRVTVIVSFQSCRSRRVPVKLFSPPEGIREAPSSFGEPWNSSPISSSLDCASRQVFRSTANSHASAAAKRGAAQVKLAVANRAPDKTRDQIATAAAPARPPSHQIENRERRESQ